MTLFHNRYVITVTDKSGKEHVDHAEHHLLIQPTAYLLKKNAGVTEVDSVTYIDMETGMPATAEELCAE